MNTTVLSNNVERAQSFLSELRAATHEMHQRLDRGISHRDTLTSRERYASFLIATLEVVAPLEGSLLGFDKLGGGFERCERTTSLLSDLADLGYDAPVASQRQQPLRDGEARCVGRAYVLEGSTLGGLVLARALRDSLGLGSTATRYLTMRGEETVPRWRAFVQRLEEWGANAAADDRREACRAARRTFEMFLYAFRSAKLLNES